jgi:hypothetical protein
MQPAPLQCERVFVGEFREVGGGLYKWLNAVNPERLKGAWFGDSTLEPIRVKDWFQNYKICFQIHLVPLRRGPRGVQARGAVLPPHQRLQRLARLALFTTLFWSTFHCVQLMTASMLHVTVNNNQSDTRE